jgi:hypothetical protein
VVDSQGQPAIIAYLEDDANQQGDPESVTTTSENSQIEVFSECVSACGSNCVDWDCERNVDFPLVYNITLLTSQSYTY